MWLVIPVIESADIDSSHRRRKIYSTLLSRLRMKKKLKGQIANILGPAGHIVSIASIQLYCCTVEAAIGNI